MNDSRYASLSSGLLARKGAAKPAMRPQSFGPLEDLGWNDMGDREEAHVPSSIAALTPSPRHEQGPATDRTIFEPVAFEPLAFDPAQHWETDDARSESDDVIDRDEADPPVEAEASDNEAEPVDTGAAEDVVSPPFVATKQREIRERFAVDCEPESLEEPFAPAAAVVPINPVAAARPQGRKSAFTLRLDSDRHLRLRLACAVTGRSAQILVTEALDLFLAEIPEIDTLAKRAGKRS